MEAGTEATEAPGEICTGRNGVEKGRGVGGKKKGEGEKEKEAAGRFEFAAAGLFVRRRKREEDVDERIGMDRLQMMYLV